jgi:uncharacterized protein (TIGR00369 family)
VMTELMIPAFANFGGKIHGGILLSMMDKAAYACAAKHAGGYCVTVSVENVDFKEPISVGELVSIHASVNYVGRTSLVIGMRVTAENVETGLIKHTNTSYFTMVAKDKNGEPTPVPPLLLETKEDARRFLEALKRRELKAQFKDEFDNEKSRLRVDAGIPLLSTERCIVAF